MKIDPYKHKERHLNWKEEVKDGIPEFIKENPTNLSHVSWEKIVMQI